MKLPPVRSWKFWMLLLGVAFVVIQLVPVERSNPPVEGDLDAVPAPVHAVLKQSCYDCHSHETAWPWYSYVAPMSWFVADHVKDGRKHLNFSKWTTLDPKRQLHKLKECREQIEEGEMPLQSYLWLHRDAVLTEADRKTLEEWFKTLPD